MPETDGSECRPTSPERDENNQPQIVAAIARTAAIDNRRHVANPDLAGVTAAADHSQRLGHVQAPAAAPRRDEHTVLHGHE